MPTTSRRCWSWPPRPEADLLQGFYPLDADRLSGGPGNDVLNAADAGGDDFVDGGAGRDTCYGDAGDTFVNCESIVRLGSGDTRGLRIGLGGQVVRDFDPADLTETALRESGPRFL